jgi:PKHD-type hydroxylase
MNYATMPIIFENAFSKKLCKKILKAKSTLLDQARIGKENIVDKDVRKSSTRFLSANWIYKELAPFLKQANELGKWNLKVDWFEPAQIAQYKKGEFYNWHVDENEEIYSMDHPNKYFRGKIRKVSCSLQLSSPSEYEGGLLEFAIPECREGRVGFKRVKPLQAQEMGTLIFFPSFLPHQAHPVTKGTRYALVAWSLGPPYA